MYQEEKGRDVKVMTSFDLTLCIKLLLSSVRVAGLRYGVCVPDQAVNLMAH